MAAPTENTNALIDNEKRDQPVLINVTLSHIELFDDLTTELGISRTQLFIDAVDYYAQNEVPRLLENK